MASRQFTVDSVKKQYFINIFLLMPETGVNDAMRKAKFTEEDIADLQLRRFLQRALPGGSIKGLKAHIAGLLPPPPDRRRQRKPPPIEDPPAATAAPPKEVADRHQHLPVDPAATGTPLREVVVDSGETVLLSLSPGTAATVRKRKAKRKQWNLTFYKKKRNIC
jgi:hypothetical protein